MMQIDIALNENFEGIPNVTRWETNDRHDGRLKQLKLWFTNGRGASIVFGQMLGFAPGIYEIAALDKAGELDYTTDIIGDDVRRGTGPEIGEMILKLSELPLEGIDK